MQFRWDKSLSKWPKRPTWVALLFSPPYLGESQLSSILWEVVAWAIWHLTLINQLGSIELKIANWEMVILDLLSGSTRLTLLNQFSAEFSANPVPTVLWIGGLVEWSIMGLKYGPSFNWIKDRINLYIHVINIAIIGQPADIDIVVIYQKMFFLKTFYSTTITRLH